MSVYFVSRHSGAVEWALKNGITAEIIEHLDVKNIESGDKVLGTLPVHIAAQVCARGGQYLHLILDLPAVRRGENLTSIEMEELGAELQEFVISEVK